MRRNLWANRRKAVAAMSTNDWHNNDDLPSAPCTTYYCSRAVRTTRGVQQTILHQQYVGYQRDMQRALLWKHVGLSTYFLANTWRAPGGLSEQHNNQHNTMCAYTQQQYLDKTRGLRAVFLPGGPCKIGTKQVTYIATTPAKIAAATSTKKQI